MIKQARDKFNQSFSDEKYQAMLADIDHDYPGMLDFRIAESPVFLDQSLKMKLKDAFEDIVEKIKKPGFKEKTERAIPESLYVENENPVPGCLAVDFAVTVDETGEYSPQLIELQGFPSLFAYQSYISEKYKDFYDIDKNSTEFFRGINFEAYKEQMSQFFLGDSKPENTILFEIFPEKQKTRIDFAITEKLWGIKSVCVTKVKRSGSELYYENESGKKITIERIYNRFILDDLDRNYPDLKLETDFSKAADVHWISHPNWFYRVSKFSLPLFQSDFIPESKYLSDYKQFPDDLENYVLKPLFSFAGAGVKINVTPEDLESVKDPDNYILQKKIKYEPCIVDHRGDKIKCEIRLLAIWPDNDENPTLMLNLGRLSRGEMIGVDFNKNFDWVGGTVGFFEK